MYRVRSTILRDRTHRIASRNLVVYTSRTNRRHDFDSRVMLAEDNLTLKLDKEIKKMKTDKINKQSNKNIVVRRKTECALREIARVD